MKKKCVKKKLVLKKHFIAEVNTKNTIIGGTGNTADCPPITLSCFCTNGCGTNGCGTNGCNTNGTCLTDVNLSCTPRGCGNSLFNC